MIKFLIFDFLYSDETGLPTSYSHAEIYLEVEHGLWTFS